MLASGALWIHIFLVVVVTWLFIGSINGWWAALVIGILHLLIDIAKLGMTKWSAQHNKTLDLTLFVADQLLHILAIICIWLFMIHGWDRAKWTMPSLLMDHRFLIRALGYIIVIGPGKYLIRYFFSRWSKDIETTNDGLQEAGVTIGILERVLVLTLVFIEQFSAIGFLVAAKSILRLIDRPLSSNDDAFSSRKHTEYVLIGTFLSFGLALLTGLIINRILGV
jgi:hypothetical protein